VGNGHSGLLWMVNQERSFSMAAIELWLETLGIPILSWYAS